MKNVNRKVNEKLDTVRRRATFPTCPWVPTGSNEGHVTDQHSHPLELSRERIPWLVRLS